MNKRAFLEKSLGKKMNRKGDLENQAVFIILNVVFFAAMLIFVAWAGKGISIKEQAYSKQIALLIDSAKPGTSLTMNITELFNIAEKEKYKGEIIKIDPQTKEVIVRLTAGKGYSYKHFNGAVISWGVDSENKLLKIEVKA